MSTNADRSLRSRLWLPAVALMLVVAAALGVWTWRSRVSQPIETYGSVPDFSLTERSGRTVTRSDLVGKVSVVDFFYTRCPDTCPLQSAHLARLQTELAHVPDVLLVSITVDPDHDTLGVLTAYAARFNADPRRWLFVTGPRDAIYRLAVDGFHLAAVASAPRTTAPESGPVVHELSPERAMAPPWAWMAPTSAWAHGKEAGTSVIQLVHASRFALVDREGQIRGYFDGTDWDDVKRLGKDLQRLLGS
jgi:protein SCO1